MGLHDLLTPPEGAPLARARAGGGTSDPRQDDESSWLERNRWWLIAVGGLILSRAIVMIVGVITANSAHMPLWSQPHWNQWRSGAPTAGSGGYFTYWDSYWYLDAAQHGWPHTFNPHLANTTGFFPALPFLLRAVHAVSGVNWVVTGVVVEVVLQVAAVLVVSALARRVLGERQGNVAVVLFCFFPGAYVFGQVYTEPVFVLVAALCLYGLHRRWWFTAGIAASLSGTIRPTGVVLMVCCAFVAIRELMTRRDWAPLLAAFLSPIGLLAWAVFLQARTGTARAYQLTQQYVWYQTYTLRAIPVEFEFFFDKHKPASPGIGVQSSYAWVILLFLAWGVVGLVVLGVYVYRRQAPVEWWLYSAGAIGVCVISSDVGVRPRMALMAFPLIFGFAKLLRSNRTLLPALAISVAGLVFFAHSVPGYVL